MDDLLTPDTDERFEELLAAGSSKELVRSLATLALASLATEQEVWTKEPKPFSMEAEKLIGVLERRLMKVIGHRPGS